jgi:hypothetical protein
MPMLTPMQSFDDVLMFTPVSTTLIFLVPIVLSVDLMWFESAHVTTNLIEFEYIPIVVTLMLVQSNLTKFPKSFVL